MADNSVTNSKQTITFGHSNEVAMIPSNENSEVFKKVTESGSSLGSRVGSLGTSDSSSMIYSSTEFNDVDKAWKLLGDTLSRYKQFHKDPGAALSLFGGLIKTNDVVSKGLMAGESLLDHIKSGGMSLADFSMNDGAVPIPGYMSREDGNIVKTAVKVIANAAKNTISAGVGGRIRPNYSTLFMAYTNSGLLNTGINLLVGDYLKTEFEKGRYPREMPAYDPEVVNEAHRLYMSTADKADGWNNPGGSAFDKVKGAVTQFVDYMIALNNGGLHAGTAFGYEVEGESLQLNTKDSRVTESYLTIGDPYDEFKDVSINKETNLFSVQSTLQSEGLLSGYKDYAGFEMGSDHLWRIRLRPYQSSKLGFTMTPPLPYYMLPDIIYSVDKSTKYKTSSIDAKDGAASVGNFDLSSITNQLTDRVINHITDQVYPVATDLRAPTGDDLYSDAEGGVGGVIEDLLGSKAKAVYDTVSGFFGGSDDLGGSKPSDFFKNTRFFSFGEDCPVLSYDLSLGTVKTESMKLFNGSTVEVFNGMNYHGVINLSILDDVYGSMYKYMMLYINSIYDIKTNSLAPYYASSFLLDLIILGSGSRIKHHYKFIVVPIEFTPRLSGSNDVQETRVDITFGIVGYVKNRSKKYIQSDNGRFLGSGETLITWNDIDLKMS